LPLGCLPDIGNAEKSKENNEVEWAVQEEQN
jgi:hypothetical protein